MPPAESIATVEIAIAVATTVITAASLKRPESAILTTPTNARTSLGWISVNHEIDSIVPSSDGESESDAQANMERPTPLSGAMCTRTASTP